ncbi:ParB/RepB/Spo0J family partition protein, partial [Salmonella enterica]
PDPQRYGIRAVDEIAVNELLTSIQSVGLLTPISVREDTEHPHHYIITNGERRWLACQKAGIKKIPAFVEKE